MKDFLDEQLVKHHIELYNSFNKNYEMVSLKKYINPVYDNFVVENMKDNQNFSNSKDIER